MHKSAQVFGGHFAFVLQKEQNRLAVTGFEIIFDQMKKRKTRKEIHPSGFSFSKRFLLRQSTRSDCISSECTNCEIGEYVIGEKMSTYTGRLLAVSCGSGFRFGARALARSALLRLRLRFRRSLVLRLALRFVLRSHFPFSFVTSCVTVVVWYAYLQTILIFFYFGLPFIYKIP